MSVEQIRRDLATLAKDLAKVRAEMAREDVKAGTAPIGEPEAAVDS